MAVSNVELLPCPFCGGSASEGENFPSNSNGWNIFIECDRCGAKSQEEYTYGQPNTREERLIVAYWNKRDDAPMHVPDMEMRKYAGD